MNAFNPMRVDELQEKVAGFARGVVNTKVRNVRTTATQPNQYKGVKLNQTLVSQK